MISIAKRPVVHHGAFLTAIPENNIINGNKGVEKWL